MARVIDWFERMTDAAREGDRAERQLAKTTRELAGAYRRGDTRRIAQLEKKGRAQEKAVNAYRRAERDAERRLSAPPRKRTPKPAAPAGPSFMVTVDYRGRKGHGRYVEFILHAPRAVTDDQVRQAVSGFARRKAPSGWTWTALRYGESDSDAREGRVKSLDELQGLLMQQNAITVGEL